MKLHRKASGRTPAHGSSAKNEIPAEWRWHYRTLLALRDHLLARSGDRMREPFDAMEPPSVHAEDFAGELYDRELADALPMNRAEALREVEDTLARIRHGEYGQCEKTGRPIPKPQLVARPWQRVAE